VSKHWAFLYCYNTLGDRKGLIALFAGEKMKWKKQLGSRSWLPTENLQQNTEWKPNPSTMERMLSYLSRQLTFKIPFRFGNAHIHLQV